MNPPNKDHSQRIVSVAVPVPLRQVFDFIVPAEIPTPCVGSRVEVNFGARKMVGIVLALGSDSEYPLSKLKPVTNLLDSEPIFDSQLMTTLRWLSAYYLAPIGEVFEAALPVNLRNKKPAMPAQKLHWRLSDFGHKAELSELTRAPLQLAIAKRLLHEDELGADSFTAEAGSWRQAIKSLVSKGWVEELQKLPSLQQAVSKRKSRTFEFTAEQTQVLRVLDEESFTLSFNCTLLHGVTGSGKTEVYFSMMEKVLASGRQVLLLVPEIGLTPQLIERLGQSFAQEMCVMHSALNDSERHLAWWFAKTGRAKIVVGTRSSIFSPFSDLGLIVIDEEHDGSLKQQDGVRYHARDVAVYRAKQLNIPIMLGSATPSLESLRNAQKGRYRLLEMRTRATKVALPRIHLIDTIVMPLTDGISPALFEAVANALSQSKQAMIFINRRGFAPVLYCSSCKQASQCHRCDANLTLHKSSQRMRCHHCGYEGRIKQQCSSCGESELVEVGEGTQRVEQALAARFAHAKVLRIDRDSSRKKGELESLLQKAKDGDADILVGTQLLTKGHDFPNVAMVGVIGVDHGLYSTDFRATELLFQQILQVAGRAGRRQDVGDVYLQTAFKHHPFFEFALKHDFSGHAAELLEQRRAANYPPFGFLALIRAESPHQAKALHFLRCAKRDFLSDSAVRVMDAIPSPMERRAGRFRAQLLLAATERAALNGVLSAWLEHVKTDPAARKLANSVRWSVDIDPIDHY